MSYVGNVKIGSTTHLVGSTLYGICDTAANTAQKVVTCANFDQLITGVTIHVFFNNSNTAANPTLKVNNTAAKAIYKQDGTPPGKYSYNSWIAQSVVSFTYNSSAQIMNDQINGSYSDSLKRKKQEISIPERSGNSDKIDTGITLDPNYYLTTIIAISNETGINSNCGFGSFTCPTYLIEGGKAYPGDNNNTSINLGYLRNRYIRLFTSTTAGDYQLKYNSYYQRGFPCTLIVYQSGLNANIINIIPT